VVGSDSIVTNEERLDTWVRELPIPTIKMGINDGYMCYTIHGFIGGIILSDFRYQPRMGSKSCWYDSTNDQQQCDDHERGRHMTDSAIARVDCCTGAVPPDVLSPKGIDIAALVHQRVCL
jgi:hypothetical protein